MTDEAEGQPWKSKFLDLIYDPTTGSIDPTRFRTMMTGARHAPMGMEEEPEQILTVMEAAERRQRVQMVTMSVDMRCSTQLMKEATDLSDYVQIMNTFFELAEKGVRHLGGWYDKFLGDGFLAYWLASPIDGNVNLLGALRSAKAVHGVWDSALDGPLRSRTHNWPADAGLSVGIDVGPGHLAIIGDELTIVGLPVVGAVRMCSAARAGETIMNSHAGYDLQQDQAKLQDQLSFSCERIVRETKEYAEQEVYSINYTQ